MMTLTLTKFLMMFFCFLALKKKKKKRAKMGMEVQGRGGRRNTRATLMSFCCSVMYANPLLLPNSSNTRDAST